MDKPKFDALKQKLTDQLGEALKTCCELEGIDPDEPVDEDDDLGDEDVNTVLYSIQEALGRLHWMKYHEEADGTT
jgi:hypothetical protein